MRQIFFCPSLFLFIFHVETHFYTSVILRKHFCDFDIGPLQCLPLIHVVFTHTFTPNTPTTFTKNVACKHFTSQVVKYIIVFKVRVKKYCVVLTCRETLCPQNILNYIIWKVHTSCTSVSQTFFSGDPCFYCDPSQ